MKLTQTFAAAALAVTTVVGTVEAAGVNLEVNKVQQRYPWNGLVDIDYTITLDEGVTLGPDENLEVLMIDKSVEPAVTNRAISFLQAPLPLTAGKHRITWDANADGVTNYFSKASFVVKIAHYAPAYMVIDVSGGPNTNFYPVTFLNGEPAGGFNVPAYKEGKIVLRRIHPGSYKAGSPDSPGEVEAGRTAASEAQHRVAISKPFYIGIFEVTQKQYQNVMGSTSFKYTGDRRPAENVTYNTIRGSRSTYNWPAVTNVAENSFMGLLIAKCKSKNSRTGSYEVPVGGFDLPLEYQWEYACRAGTTGAFNTTNSYDNTNAEEQEAQLVGLGRYKSNGGTENQHATVGMYAPNAWGLYDMHGNVCEWCRDWYRQKAETLHQYVDPVGDSTGTYQPARGGCWRRPASSCRSASRDTGSPGEYSGDYGFRLFRAIP